MHRLARSKSAGTTAGSAPGPRGRWWTRLERRAITAYEDDVLTVLQCMIRGAVPLTGVTTTQSPIGLVRMYFPCSVLGLAGVAHQTSVSLSQVAVERSFSFSAAGRYGRCWWLELSSADQSHLITATHVRLILTEGGGNHARRKASEVGSR